MNPKPPPSHRPPPDANRPTPARIFEIYAERRKIGIVVAASAQLALESAYFATTRRTESKMDESCDYTGLVVRELLGRPANIGEWLPQDMHATD